MASQLPAHLWWDRYGIRVPVLRDVARRLLAQQAGSGAAERVNSEMGFIKNRRSNRMNDPTFERLEWIHHNLRLRRKYYNETCCEEVWIVIEDY